MIKGKTIFSWNVPEIANGDPVKFAQVLREANFEGVLLKAGDGNKVHSMKSTSPWPNWGTNIKPSLVKNLKAAGLKVYLWSFLYGIDPQGELEIAIKQTNAFQPDGYIWDVESAFDSRLKAVSNARLISQGYKSVFPTTPQALCWWALPYNPNYPTIQWHPVAVAKAFMETVDCVMPMMYWGGSSPEQAVDYLLKSLRMWRSITQLPLAPIGRAYTGDSGYINPRAIEAFSLKIHEMKSSWNLIGNSWWSLDHAYQVESAWKALTNTEKFSLPDSNLGLSNEEVLKRLVDAHKDLFPEIFNS